MCVLSRAETNTVQGNGSSLITGQLKSTSEQRWEDTAWIFLTVEVPYQDLLVLQLNYSGTLDLDMMLFVEQDPNVEQKMIGWDISHCRFDYPKEKLVAYSQARTTNTNENTTELIEFRNTIPSPTARIAYLLIYVFSGTGTSDFILNIISGHSLTVVPNEQLNSCILVYLYWLIFVAVVSLFSIIFIRIVKNKTMTEEQKRAREEKKKAKLKKSGKEEEAKRKKEQELMKKRMQAAKRR